MRTCRVLLAPLGLLLAGCGSQSSYLRAVRTAGALLASLEKKLSEVSDRISKSTFDLVALQEKLMVSRIRFQDGVADLSLDKHGSSPHAVASAPRP